jgi:HPt (histidine-containing phosphotransfer) domain-containing protein
MEPSASMIGGSVTDLSYLRSFCEEDKERMQKYLNIFLKSAPAVIEKINDALMKNDLAGIVSQAHGYKTELVMMGMSEAKDLAIAIEMLYNEGNNIDEVKDKTVKLVRHIEMAISELK